LPGSYGEEYLTRRGIPIDVAMRYGVGYAPPGQWPHKKRDWRWGRVVVPHTTPNGRIVNLYGRAVGADAKVPKPVRHDHLPGAKGYCNATVLDGEGPVYVCEGAFDALSLLAAGVERSVAIYGVDGWRWDWLREVRELILCFDADAAGAKWRELAREARWRGKVVRYLDDYGGGKDVNEAWVCGCLADARTPTLGVASADVL
jgi:DNA primase